MSCVLNLLAILPLAALPAAAQLTIAANTGASASLSVNGSWSLTVGGPQWRFAGALGAIAIAPHVNTGTDNLGDYQELAFSYSVAGVARSGSVRLYSERPLVLFFSVYNTAGANSCPFPLIAAYPSLPHLSYNGEFASPDFTALNNDSPWVFFDQSYNTWILSPAANYMTASNAVQANGNIAAGISSDIASLPAGFTHVTALVFGQGINATFGAWGQALLDLSGKQRLSNSADTLLKNISYWTDNGATYYYNPGGTYMSTLDAVRAEFDAMSVKLGSLQLDSWWYPKGPDDSWSSHSGIWTYTAAPDLFQPDLASFQAGLNVPLITHARWIDAASPYRSQYTISGNVATDPQYWEDIGDYLKKSGAVVYEQDWLGDNAHTDFNLTDPYLFLGNMAASMASRNINIQYCMAEPKHFLQSTAYGNVTNVRVSQDRFVSGRWTSYFYSSQFASAIGLWPFSDVFMSTETDNFIAALLSGGPVGIGDPVGSISKSNLVKAARADGALVKPDFSATPLDSVYLNDAQGIDVPMIASASTDFGGGLKANYIFAYQRAANATVIIDPSVFGISGASVLYDSSSMAPVYIAAGQTYTFNLTGAPGYYILVPVGQSGIGFLGDKGHFVTLGRQRIASLADRGVADITVSFAPGEKSRTLFGYAPLPISVSSLQGTHREPQWNANSQLFEVVVTPNAKGTAHVQLAVAANANPGGIAACAIRCSN